MLCTMNVERIMPPRQLPSVRLGGFSHVAAATAVVDRPATLAAPNRVARVQRSLLLRRERDVSDPEADGADRDADHAGDLLDRKPLLGTQPASQFPHEHTFAQPSDGTVGIERRSTCPSTPSGS